MGVFTLFEALAVDLYVDDNDFSMLLSQLAKHHDLISEQDTNGLTLLHYAAISGDRKLFDILLPYCEHSINLKNHSGDTALMMAAKQNHREIYDLLITAGADQTALTNESRIWSKGLTAEDITILHAEGKAPTKIPKSDLNRLDTYRLRDGNFKTILESFSISELVGTYQHSEKFTHILPIVLDNLSRNPSSFIMVDQVCDSEHSRMIFDGMLAEQISSASIINLINKLPLERLQALTLNENAGRMIIAALNKDSMPLLGAREEKHELVREIITNALANPSIRVNQELSRTLRSFDPELSSKLEIENMRSEFDKLNVRADQTADLTHAKGKSESLNSSTSESSLLPTSLDSLPKRQNFVEKLKTNKGSRILFP